MTVAFIADVDGLKLTLGEKHLFAQTDPWAFILFGRNCETPEQISALCKDLRAAVGRNCLIFIDQEGGRVQRLGPPIWPHLPPLALYGALWSDSHEQAIEACQLHHQLAGYMLRAVGLSANCVPCLDLRVAGAHHAIGDRAFSSEPACVASLGQAALDGLQCAGVVGVIKHLPGQGRAHLDSHEALPKITASKKALRADIAPFMALKEAPIGMVGHMAFKALDPDQPASLSAAVIKHWIRGEIGFSGLLITDDLSMGALDGPDDSRIRRAFDAGCDVTMLCHRPLAAREAILKEAKALEGEALKRALRAQSHATEPSIAFDCTQVLARHAALTGYLWPPRSKMGCADPTTKAWA
ncbi:beta-N-acetylhexosaminidase [Candidatus Phycosocius spiralis]|uniref:beta-N-acetylhexosaminidase n=1 Tax=Candidatus Phycosocius spiralis TaxID=2815099 RepID=A0ABQ4PX35_9PROT|nr:beta-N-acetylhexosaminidase [Candidatus Phycosocius spiralis]GIU67536.1 beta-N-acetylhexosaminidase [Candidatus Phycosocius spiralis]